MDRALCIHGHFYQPPREDPWLGRILPEGSAAPAVHWNERICRESYAPMARARRQDGGGRIVELFNCYSHMSFNAGPTLMSWMARSAPDTYARILEADRESVKRLGHGNALAQIYHHVIMPLATERDKRLEVVWAVEDFKARFGRDPEGMWLSETAVDTPTLEALAQAGIRFTILAPSQATAISDNGRDWRGVDAGSLDIRRPYAVRLPSGREIAVFFYHGPLSQAVAFENLLADGEHFFRRLSESAGAGLLSLATDGETYGHHFKFGEMALAYALDQAKSGRDGLTLTNFAAYLAANPPKAYAKIREASAWSCAHGVERWRSDCGCTAGDHPGYNQRWRAPLRNALDLLKSRLDAHYDAKAGVLFKDPEAALNAYGQVLAGTQSKEGFERLHMTPASDAVRRGTAWKLLSMQAWGLASFASCAWFFDEISRLEPVNAMTFALRAVELARATGMADPEPEILTILAQARSNEPAMGSGADIWETMARPRRETPRTLIAQALVTLALEDRLPLGGEEAVATWPGVAVTVRLENAPAGAPRPGSAAIVYRHETAAERYELTYTPSPKADPFAACAAIRPASGGAEEGFAFTALGLPVNKRQALADAFSRHHAEVFHAENLAAAAVARSLVTERQEAQNTLTLAPLILHLWPGLLWLEVFEPPLPPKKRELLHLFLKHTGDGSPVKAALEARIAAETARLIDQPDPDWRLLARLTSHAAELGLHPDWWAAQNALWQRWPFTGPARELAEALGFAV
ncbi:MAG: alpha-amylase/alpha-mannosidase [Solidesulfovibrio magneticus str. Maddingley MBC34]|uniref:Alpha-amylase/alpha-mannosidase n=1 Tax=Solidesulfovibrio magneticus str. Maddingley MBC34 TaxID=1206767 RepID=K6GQN1_9BACT|nr:MAG: alpha-amylase/alpha-mannosidase [Solidesulfovibrio magneticus str. Maddingley MBC34]